MPKNRSNSLEKFLDRYIGSLILRVFSLFMTKRELPENIKKIAIIKPSAIGDTVLVSLLINELKRNIPGVEITLFTGLGNAIVVPYMSGVDHHIVIPVKNPFKSISLIRKNKFDLFIDTDSWPRLTAIYSVLSKSKYTIGFKTKHQNRHYCFDLVIDHDDGVHEIENYSKLISKIVEVGEKIYKLNVDSSSDEVYSVFHLWPSGYKSSLREWRAENWYELASHIPFNILLSGSPEENYKNEIFVENAPENLKGKFVNLAKTGDFSETMSKIKNARFVVSVNTGIMHISAALGVPTIGLSGPTNPQRWGALGENSYNVVPEGSGHCFLNLGFEYEGQREDSMDLIAPEKIITIVKKIL